MKSREEVVRRLVAGRVGVTREEAAVLGIDWPPVKGWRKRVIDEWNTSPPFLENGFLYRKGSGKYHVLVNGITLCRKVPNGRYVSSERAPDDRVLCLTCEGLKKTDPKNQRFNKPSISFYASWEWKKARYETLKKYGAVCMLCGSRERIVVDHIKPRRFYPELELSLDNLQVLCDDCNKGKSFGDQTDFRGGMKCN